MQKNFWDVIVYENFGFYCIFINNFFYTKLTKFCQRILFSYYLWDFVISIFKYWILNFVQIIFWIFWHPFSILMFPSNLKTNAKLQFYHISNVQMSARRCTHRFLQTDHHLARTFLPIICLIIEIMNLWFKMVMHIMHVIRPLKKVAVFFCEYDFTNIIILNLLLCLILPTITGTHKRYILPWKI